MLLWAASSLGEAGRQAGQKHFEYILHLHGACVYFVFGVVFLTTKRHMRLSSGIALRLFTKGCCPQCRWSIVHTFDLVGDHLQCSWGKSYTCWGALWFPPLHFKTVSLGRQWVRARECGGVFSSGPFSVWKIRLFKLLFHSKLQKTYGEPVFFPSVMRRKCLCWRTLRWKISMNSPHTFLHFNWSSAQVNFVIVVVVFKKELKEGENQCNM